MVPYKLLKYGSLGIEMTKVCEKYTGEQSL